MTDISKRLSGLSAEKLKLLAERLKKATETSTEGVKRRAPGTNTFPLSFEQERLWFIDQLEPNSSAFNNPLAFRTSCAISEIDQSLNDIVLRHEILRSSFRTVDGQPVQVIAPSLRLMSEVVDLSGLPDSAREAKAGELATKEAQRPFNLTTGPLIRAVILVLGKRDYLFVCTLHHTVSDGFSIGPLQRELFYFQTFNMRLKNADPAAVNALLETFASGNYSRLPELPIQYVDYAVWQRERLQGDVLDRLMGYWKPQLEGLPRLNLPTDYQQPSAVNSPAARQVAMVSAELAASLNELSQREGVTLFMTLLTVFKVLLYRYTGQQDIVVGSPITGRNLKEAEELIGFFVNMLVLRTKVDGSQSFREILGKVKEVCLGAYAHQEMPFAKLVKELNPERDMGKQPLFQVAFQLNTTRTSFDMQTSDSAVPSIDEGMCLATKRAIFDLNLTIDRLTSGRVVGEGGLRCVLEYDTSLFEAQSVERMIRHFEQLLEKIIEDTDQPIAEIDIMSEDEKRQLLVEWNDTAADYEKHKCLGELFEEQAGRTPDSVAVEYEGQQVTYAELNRRANQLGHYLRRRGVGPDVLVGICLERGLEMMVGLLGIVKAGGAYLPLGTDYPQERLKYMVEGAEAKVLLTRESLRGVLPAIAGEVICLDSAWAEIAKTSDENLLSGTVGDNLAYVMYTSGSTGLPKGICVTQSNVARLVKNNRYANLSADEVILQFAPISFDASTFEIWGALLNGGRLAVFRAGMPSLEELGRSLRDLGITTLWLTTELFNQMIDQQAGSLKGLRQLLTGGEAASIRHMRRAVEELSECRVINCYGPTEGTTFTSSYDVRARERVKRSVPIGHPIGNAQIYIAVGTELVPAGAAGELLLGGEGLARGYLNRPELTAEKFIPNVYGDVPGQRLYKTGDLGRYRTDGEIEFIGREDGQVKIRGHRIELGEIETMLATHPAVQEAVVTVRDDLPGTKRLVAYVVCNPNAETTTDTSAAASLPHERVSHWKMIFDDLYSGNAACCDPTFNIIGWDSSYTDEPIPAPEMEEWLEDTVQLIQSLHPRRVLEIGCGTGLPLFRVAPQCELYRGTDMSRQALDYIQFHWADSNHCPSRIELLQQAADNFDDVAPESFDTVIFNSVIQFFPCIDYLVRVLEDAVKATAPGGAIFIGDVRHLPLLDAFHTAVALHHADRDLPLAGLRQRMQDGLRTEDELVVDPAFFFALKRHLPRISAVQIFLKRGSAHNELTQFRYQVIIHVGQKTAQPVEIDWMDWDHETLNLPAIKSLLTELSPEVFGIRGIANARVIAETTLVERFVRGFKEPSHQGPQTVGDLQEMFSSARDKAIDPHDLWKLSEASGYESHLSWARSGRDGSFDVIFVRKDAGEGFAKPDLTDCFGPPAETQAQSRPWSHYANNPLRGNIARRMTTDLRSYLQAKMPDYMIPSAFVLMDALPLNPNGKVDRRALPAVDSSRPQLAEEFVEAGNEIEQLLAGLWAEVLRLDQVGINDNFFSLGGDSILGIQIISRANQAGLQLSPRQIFQHQTVAELAAAAGTARHIEAEQSPVEGAVPLTPVQRWFFEQELADPHHFNQARMLEVDQQVDTGLLKKVIDEIVNHHDALRLRFDQLAGNWEQHNSRDEAGEIFLEIDLSHVPNQEQAPAINEAATRIQASLNLQAGPLIKAALINLGEERGKRLLLVIHHLAVDGVSWRILLEDLNRGYEQAKHGDVNFGRKVTSYKQWAEQLIGYAQSEALQQEANYWIDQKPADEERVPLDYEAGENNVDSTQNVAVWLSEEETRALLQDVPATYRTQINDGLLTALALAYREWTGSDRLLIDLEGHGREEIIEGADITRTVGWFTAIYPVLLRLGEGEELGEQIKQVKEQLRRIPNKGIGYGLLKYLTEDKDTRSKLQKGPEPAIVFNYLGQLGQPAGQAGTFKSARERVGPVRSGNQKRRHVLEVNGGVFGGRLQMIWTYSANLHRQETVETLAESYIKWLRAIIAHCTSIECGGYTPSDFPLSGLNQAQLDTLVGTDANVEDIYRLSPMQEGLLFHSLYQPEDATYMVQLSLLTEGRMNLEEFESGWQRVASKNEVLRAGFLWEGVEDPVQVVRKRVTVPVAYEDWRGRSSEEQQKALESFLSEDRKRGFDLTEPPLMRICLIRRAENLYQWTWTFHHLLMDGWSLPIILTQLSGAADEAGRARPYRNYIEWLSKQDMGEAENFWRESLRGFTEPTRLGIEKLTYHIVEPEGRYVEQSIKLSKEVSERLEHAAREQRLTANTLVQGGWALLLSRYSGEKDVVYGATVSGRPADLAGIENTVGVFINTLPVRMQIRDGERVADCLRRLQEHEAEMRQYEYSPLVRVQGWSEVPRGEALFESIFAYENYPMLRSLQDRARSSKLTGRAKIRELRSIERTNYPLSVVAVPGEEMLIKIIYDKGRYEADTISRMIRHYEKLLESLAQNLEQRVTEIDILTVAEKRRLLTEWNDTAAAYPQDKCIPELLEEGARLAADRVAVVYEDQQITYGELNRRANQLAHCLRSQGVGPEVVVGICVDRSVEMVVGLFGILKAGGAYLPLDPQYPRQRLSYMLDDAQARLLVTTDALLEQLGGVEQQAILLDAGWDWITKHSEQNPDRQTDPRNTAYVIYTSGSTGLPKGAMVEHRGVFNMADAQMRHFGVTADSCNLQFASLSFDASIFEIIMALRAGARLCLAKKERLLPGPDFIELLRSQAVTHITMPPSALALVPEASLPELETIIVAGESCPEDLAARWGKGRRFFNAYGPTEATVWSSLLECEGSGVPTIGRPIANVQLFILDKAYNPVPPGARGEIYIAGDSLARGYIGRAEMTAQRFLPNEYGGGAGARFYRTGDLGRYRADGQIEYLGRADDQVKVRGYRIELGEIEAALRDHEWDPLESTCRHASLSIL